MSKKWKYQLKNEKKENKKIRKSNINCQPEIQSSLSIQLSPDLNKALPIPSFDESILKDNSSTQSETSNISVESTGLGLNYNAKKKIKKKWMNLYQKIVHQIVHRQK